MYKKSSVSWDATNQLRDFVFNPCLWQIQTFWNLELDLTRMENQNIVAFFIHV